MRCYKLASTQTSTGTGVSPLQIIANGRVRSVIWSGEVDSQTDNSSISLQLATQAIDEKGTLTTSPVSMSGVQLSVNFTTSGLAIGGINECHVLDYPIEKGGRLLLNATVSGTLNSATFDVWVYVQEGGN